MVPGGLGLALCEGFLNLGAIVIAADVDDLKIEKIRKTVCAESAKRLEIIKLDVSNASEVEKFFLNVYKKYKKIDVLINNAGGGLGLPKDLERISSIDFDTMIGINLKGTFLCCQKAIEYMRKSYYGRIINISSIGSKIPSKVSSPSYAAAKGGVNALTRRLALSEAKYGITVNAIAPGTIITGCRMEKVWQEMDDNDKQFIKSSIPVGRMCKEDDILNAACFLASPLTEYVTGIVLDVNGGRFMG